MFFTVLILLIYISTVSGSLFNLIRTNEKNLLTPINIFIGFFLLFMAPFFDMLSYAFDFNSINSVIIVIIFKTFSILFLLNGVAGLKLSMVDNETRVWFKIYSMIFVSYSLIIAILLSLFLSIETPEYTKFPIVFSNNRLNLLIMIIDSLTMAIIVVLLPKMRGFFEPLAVKIGSSAYLVAAIFLYSYSLNNNPLFFRTR